MASFKDAAAGWEIYRDWQDPITRTELNQILWAQGFKPISNRTFKHYNKLLQLGYTDYVSINRLDIRHANNSVFDLSDRSRYQDRSLNYDGLLVLPIADKLVTLPGKIGKVSEGFAMLRVPNTSEAMKASNATKYNKGILVFEEVDLERAVRVVEGIGRGTKLDLLLEFRNLLETDLVFPASPFPLATSRLTMDLGPEVSFYRILGVVHVTFDLFESIRGFVDLLTVSASERPPTNPALRVKQMQFANPLEVVFVSAVMVVYGVTFILERVARAIGSVVDTASKVQALGREKNAERRREELHQTEIKSLQLEYVKKEIKIGSICEELNPHFTEATGMEIPKLTSKSEQHLKELKNQAVEAAAELELASNKKVALDRIKSEN